MPAQMQQLWEQLPQYLEGRQVIPSLEQLSLPEPLLKLAGIEPTAAEKKERG